MKSYYISLCRELCGYYVRVKAPTHIVVRLYAQRRFGSVWCSVYGQAAFDNLQREQPTKACVVVNESNPTILGEDGEEIL